MGIVFTDKDLEQIMMNPEKIVNKVLTQVEQYALIRDQKLEIQEGVSPFVSLLDATCYLGANAIIENENHMRTLYPTLANTPKQIARHLSDEELSGLFALPTKAVYAFFVPVHLIKQHGVNHESYQQVTIPGGLAIKILDYTFTMLNNINIKLYNSTQNVEVEVLYHESPFASEVTGVIDTELITDNANTPFIVFSLDIKQFRVQRLIKPINKSIETKEEYVHPDEMYMYSESRWKNSESDPGGTKLKRLLNEEYIDITEPSVCLTLLSKSTIIRLPSVYKFSNNVSGVLESFLYLTRGKQVIPVANFPETMFQYELPKDSLNTLEKAAMKQIPFRVKALTNSFEGKNVSSMSSIRKAIIFNATGINELPITDEQIKQKGNLKGYNIVKDMDILTGRNYLALKRLEVTSEDKDMNMVRAPADIYFNRVGIVIEEYSRDKQVIIDGNTFVIKAGTMFEEENGLIKIVHSGRVADIKLLSKEARIEYANQHNLFYTPLYYYINVADGFTTCDIYNLSYPKFDHRRTTNINTNSQVRVNSSAAMMEKLENGFRLIITAKRNPVAKKQIPIDKLRLQVGIPILNEDGEESFLYFNGVHHDKDGTDIFTVDFITDYRIKGHKEIALINGKGNVKTQFVPLSSKIVLFYFGINLHTKDPTEFMQSQVLKDYEDDNIFVFTKETATLLLGEQVKYIHTSVANTFTSARYKTYPDNVYAVAEEDTYKIFEDTGTIVSSTNEMKLLYKKGDILTDEEGNPIIRYQKGANILDEFGKPILDVKSGLMRFIDILMIEYEYQMANSIAYNTYRDELIMPFLLEGLQRTLGDINSKLLENTVVNYKSYRSAKPIQVLVNKEYDYIPYKVKPTVTLFVKRKDENDNLNIDTLKSYESKIGQTLERVLLDRNYMTVNAQRAIMEKLGENQKIVTCNVTGIYDGDPAVIAYNNDLQRPMIAKKLEYDNSHNVIVVYDLTLRIEYLPDT